ncbi:MAG TPA: beta-propeller fold lactonase family protein [Terriglobia bacterium]
MRAKVVAALCMMMTGLTGCITGGKQFAYVIGPSTNEVFQFQILSNGQLTALTPNNFPGGPTPVSVVIHTSGLFAYVANFAGNAVTLLAVNRGNGQLTVPVNTNPIPPPTPANVFNTGTGPIALAQSPAGTFLFVANQGSGDIDAFSIDQSTGNLGFLAATAIVQQPSPPAPPVPGAHPNSMAISPNGNLLLTADPVLGEVAAFSVDSNGGLTEVAGSPFVIGGGATPTFITVDPSSRFAYVSDPAHNSILGFSMQSNQLTPIPGSPFAAGTQPLGMTLSPQGAVLYVANRGSNNVSAFVIDSNSGALATVPGSPFATAGQGPNFVAASSTFVYVTDQTTNDVSAFTIGANGALSPVTGSPFNVATSPLSITLVSQ